MSHKKNNSFMVKMHNVVNGIIHAVEQEFKTLEEVIAHLGQNGGAGYKVYDPKGELIHSQNSKHRRNSNDDDTYA